VGGTAAPCWTGGSSAACAGRRGLDGPPRDDDRNGACSPSGVPPRIRRRGSREGRRAVGRRTTPRPSVSWHDAMRPRIRHCRRPARRDVRFPTRGHVAAAHAEWLSFRQLGSRGSWRRGTGRRERGRVRGEVLSQAEGFETSVYMTSGDRSAPGRGRAEAEGQEMTQAHPGQTRGRHSAHRPEAVVARRRAQNRRGQGTATDRASTRPVQAGGGGSRSRARGGSPGQRGRRSTGQRVSEMI